MTRLHLAVVALVCWPAAALAQNSVASSGSQTSTRPGWIFTPSMGLTETYDDNVSLFDVHIAPGENNDFVTSYAPAADLQYGGAHTQFGVSYSGSFLSYRTFDALNRWAQRGSIDFKRQESARLWWTAVANAESVPTTDAVDFGGLPYRHTGVKTADGRTSVEYRFNARDGIVSEVGFQVVDFDRTTIVPGNLEGGHAIDASTGWRHRLDERLSLGAQYGIRRSTVFGDASAFLLHSFQGAFDYTLSPTWSMSALAGLIYMQQNDIAASQTGPAVRVAFTHHRESLSLRAWYEHTYTPSFAFGGTVRSLELAVGLRTPLFHSRRFYTDQSAEFRDDQPLTNLADQLPLRSFRSNSVFGWMPQPYVRIEAFYSRTQQSSLRVGGLVYRNRVGVQIVTFKPVRID
jgi:hypothetical protein